MTNPIHMNHGHSCRVPMDYVITLHQYVLLVHNERFPNFSDQSAQLFILYKYNCIIERTEPIARQSSEIAHYEQVTHWCNAKT